MSYKKDNKLGNAIHKHLYELGIETPMRGVPNFDKEKIERHFKVIMNELGLDLQDDSLQKTPYRVAKMFVDEIFYGLDYTNFPAITTVQNKMKYDEMICVNDIAVSSTCEHHFVVIDGKAKIAYIPQDRVIGLSKINRVVDFFAKRPQIQERLTEQIYFALQYILQTDDIAVRIEAVHHCVKQRGVKDTNSFTTTQKLGGVFLQNEVRNEFLNF